MVDLKKQYSNYIDYQLVAFPTPEPDITDKETLALLEKALNKGAEVIGGCPTLAPDYKEFIDVYFKFAKSTGCPLDFHVDETDQANIDALEYLAEKTISEGYEGRVTAGHCCSLSAVDDYTAKRVITKVKAAGITIVTLPSCNLYLMGRGDKQPISRGITRVKDLIEAGVKIAVSSDNLRDPFRPFGNFNLLQEALLTAQVAQMGSIQDFDTLFEMITFNPANAMQLKDYGLKVGCEGDLLITTAENSVDAIVSQSILSYVIKRGKVVAKNTKNGILL